MEGAPGLIRATEEGFPKSLRMRGWLTPGALSKLPLAAFEEGRAYLKREADAPAHAIGRTAPKDAPPQFDGLLLRRKKSFEGGREASRLIRRQGPCRTRKRSPGDGSRAGVASVSAARFHEEKALRNRGRLVFTLFVAIASSLCQVCVSKSGLRFRARYKKYENLICPGFLSGLSALIWVRANPDLDRRSMKEGGPFLLKRINGRPLPAAHAVFASPDDREVLFRRPRRSFFRSDFLR
jgi:hypothetical protein